MYHIAKVIDIFSKVEPKTLSADGSVQAQLEMWDDNLIIFAVHPELATGIQRGQYVLVEYGFHAPNVPVNTVIKILDAKQGEAAWKKQKSYFERKKKQMRPPSEMENVEALGEHGMVH